MKSYLHYNKINIISILCFSFINILTSCQTAVKNEQNDVIVLTDDLGRTVKIKRSANRFLPLAPSITEMLSLICDSQEIVGRTPYCNYPISILSKPIVNNYPPDLEKIIFLHPDLVITKEGMLSLAQATAIENIGIPVYFQKYDNVTDILRGIEKLGHVTNHIEKGKFVSDSLRTKISQLKSIVTVRKKILMLISKENYYVFGKNTYASDIITIAGGINAVDTIFSNPFPLLSTEYILSINPDIIIAGNQVGITNNYFDLHPALKRTNAYKNGNYYSIDDDYLSRPGPRVAIAIDTIKSIIVKTYSQKK